MESQSLKTPLNLTKDQLQTIVNEHILQQGGVHQVFEVVINSLMYSERAAFLTDNPTLGNKANGYRSLVKAGIGQGLSLAIPRDRLSAFKPLILGIVNQQQEQINELCFSLYGKGLTTRQISEVLKDIYGTNYSKTTVSRISESFYGQIQEWMDRKLDTYYPVLFIDALYLKVKRDVVSSEAFYIVLGLKEDFTREVLMITSLPQESACGWQEVLMSLKERGLESVGLFVSDDLKGLDIIINKEYGGSKHQKCILHFQRSLSKHVRVKDRARFCLELKEVFCADEKSYTAQAGINHLKELLLKWGKLYPYFVKVSQREDLWSYFTYLSYDYRVRRMLYTTNWVERFNKSVKRCTKIRNSLPTPRSALMLIGYVGMEMERGVYSYPISSFGLEEQLQRKSNG
jgi:putative transposase